MTCVYNLGRRGTDGMPGIKPSHGSIMYYVYDVTGTQVIESNPIRFNASITKYQFVDELADGIYEPNELLTVSNINVWNNGGLTLPATCMTYIHDSPTVSSMHENYEMQPLAPNDTTVIPFAFKARIRDIPSPTKTGPLRTTCEFNPCINLLGREFDESKVAISIPVQYPVEIISHRAPEKMARNDLGEASVHVKNFANKDYGISGLGSIDLVFKFDPRLVPQMEHQQESDGSLMVKQSIPLIQGQQTLNIRVPFKVSVDADFYNKYGWTCFLYLRNKLVQIESHMVTVCPTFTEGVTTDMLLVLHHGTERTAFLNWMHILYTLNCTINFWDTEYNRGIHI